MLPSLWGHDRGQTIAGLTIAGLTIAGLTIAIRVLPTLAPRREPPAVGQAWTPFHHARASAAFEDLHAARGLPGASQIPIDHWTFPKGPQTAVDIPSRALNRRFGELCVGTASFASVRRGDVAASVAPEPARTRIVRSAFASGGQERGARVTPPRGMRLGVRGRPLRALGSLSRRLSRPRRPACPAVGARIRPASRRRPGRSRAR